MLSVIMCADKMMSSDQSIVRREGQHSADLFFFHFCNRFIICHISSSTALLRNIEMKREIEIEAVVDIIRTDS